MMFIFLLLQTAFASNWLDVKCPDDKILAEEFLRFNLSGESLDIKNNSCLLQKDYKYLQVVSAMPEGDPGPSPKIIRLKNYTITNIEKKDKEFFINFKGTSTSGKVIEDSISFYRLDKSPSKKLLGCAMLGTRELSKEYLLDKCK